MRNLRRPVNQFASCQRQSKNALIATVIAIATLGGISPVPGQQPADTVLLARQQFQAQELIPSRFGGWFFQLESPPRIIWRDIEEVRRLGGDVALKTRWFDANLNESPQPNASGRWLAWVEGRAPNGTPFRRSFTFFAIPEKIEPEITPDLTVALPKFPGPDTPIAWKEHQWEIDQAAGEFMTRGLIDSEDGAILVAGIIESKPLGRQKRFIESTAVVNEQFHLSLKLKVLGLADKVETLQPPRVVATPATMLHDADPGSENYPADAKAKIDEFCRRWNAATGEPFVTLIAKDGEIITHEAFGRDPQGNAIDKNYRCWIASLTKTVTGILFLQFLDQHLIELDAPISSVFPDYPANDPHVPTFRQCLNHTAGLASFGDFGGMRNPHLENIVLNGIDVVQPGIAHSYCGLGFELVAKAMEIVSGRSAVELFHHHLFQPLRFGDVIIGNASSDGEFSALELATLGQLLANRGRYGEMEFFSQEAFESFLPRPLNLHGSPADYGLGTQWIRHRKPSAAAGSNDAEDLLFSPRTIGHGSFSGCIMIVDLERKLVIVQVRRKFADADNPWWTEFFQVIAESISDDTSRPPPH